MRELESYEESILKQVSSEWRQTTGGTSEDIDIHGRTREDKSDRGFYERYHTKVRGPYKKSYKSSMERPHDIVNAFSVELDIPGFQRNIRTAFLQELEIMQQEYISFVSGVYRNASFMAFPGTPKIIADTARSLIGDFKARVADKNKFYLAYVEWGTGLNVELPGYNTSMMEQALGNPPRTIARLNGYITGRGKGCAWTDPAGVEHPGADFLFIPLKKDAVPIRNKEDREGEDKTGFKIRRKSSGQRAKRMLFFATRLFLTPTRLLKFTQDVFQRALNMSGSYKNTSGQVRTVTAKQYKKLEAMGKK